MLDYAGAWSAERGRCHHLVYDHEGKPTGCPAPPMASGWRQDYQGRWYVVDACSRHSGQLVSRPRAGWQLGHLIGRGRGPPRTTPFEGLIRPPASSTRPEPLTRLFWPYVAALLGRYGLLRCCGPAGRVAGR